MFRLFSGCFSAVLPALCSGPTRLFFRLFFRLFSGCFQCQAFTSVDRDCSTSIGRRTEQATANLDPRVGHEWHHEWAHEWTHECAHEIAHESAHDGLISLFSAHQGLPRKLPRNVHERVHESAHRKCPVKWSRFTCPVFTCSVRRPSIDLSSQSSPELRLGRQTLGIP